MNYIRFLHMLNEEIIANQGHTAKRIILFRKAEEYRQCIRLLNRLKPSLSRLSSVQPIHIIHALTCSLHSYSRLAKYDNVICIEDDAEINVHAYSFIQPIDRPNPKPYLAKHKIPWGVKRIKAPFVWNRTMGNHVRIGVVDTGVDYYHPDLRGCLSRGINLVTRHSLPLDDNGHGTHIAGTIAAGNQRMGIMGVAPHATLYPIKAFDHKGTAYVSDIVLAIDWCVRNRMDIINMSFGMKSRSQSLFDAVRNAYYAGVIIVASSGNEGIRTRIDYPARFPQTISVGALTRKNGLASFSNRGKAIDLYAPGEKIFSTWLGGKYNELSGTSMATSHVSGLVALVLSMKPGLKPDQMKALLKKGGTSLLSQDKLKPSALKQIDALRTLKYIKT